MQRERRGWGGDAQASSDTAAWNFDMAAYWSQYLGTLADNQLKYASANPTPGGGAGGISGVVPDYGYDGGGGCQPYKAVTCFSQRAAFAQIKAQDH